MRIIWGSVVSVTLGLPFLIAAFVEWIRAFGKKDRKHLFLGFYFLGTWYILWFPIHLWFWQFALTGRAPAPASYIEGAVWQIALPVGWLIWSCFHRFRPVITALVVAFLFSLLLQLFSYIYWSYGTPRNFGTSLSHLDSFYFALGTLTTAGTGSISAISETARGIQALQMGLDLAIVGFTVALVLARYSGLFPRSKREVAAAAPTQAAPAMGRPASRRRRAGPRIQISSPRMRPKRSARKGHQSTGFRAGQSAQARRSRQRDPPAHLLVTSTLTE